MRLCSLMRRQSRIVRASLPTLREGSGPPLLSIVRSEGSRLPDPVRANDHLILKARVPAHLRRPGTGSPVPVLAALFFAVPPGTSEPTSLSHYIDVLDVVSRVIWIRGNER